MSSPIPQPWTVDDFLAWERLQEERYEFLDGIIFPRFGRTLDHGTIAGNVFALLRDALRGRALRAFVACARVTAAGGAIEPDVVVAPDACDARSDHVSEPVVIVDVLTRAPRGYQRGRKWVAYQTIASLRHYVLVSQDEWRVECYTRRGDAWEYAVATGRDVTLALPAINAAIPLAAIYESTSLDQAARSA